MNVLTVRRLINEEINRNVRIEMILTRDEIYAMRQLESRVSSLNEAIDWGFVKEMAIVALKTKAGRKILISLFKAVKFLFDTASLPVTKISIPMWRRVFGFMESKGIRLPFNPEDLFEFIEYYMPSNLLSMSMTELIKLLDGMNDDQYLEMIGQKDEKPSEKDQKGKRQLTGDGSPRSPGAEDDEEAPAPRRPLARARRRG